MIPVTHLAAVGIALNANHNNAKRILENRHKYFPSSHPTSDSNIDKGEPVSSFNTNTKSWNDAVNVTKEAQEMTKNLMKILGVEIDD